MKIQKDFEVTYRLPGFRGRTLLSITLQVLGTLLPIAMLFWFLTR